MVIKIFPTDANDSSKKADPPPQKKHIMFTGGVKSISKMGFPCCMRIAKVRASYGEMGNQNIGGSNLDVNISYISEGLSWYNFSGGGAATSGAYVASKGNTNLTWESTTSTNFALDMGFMDNKLQATIDIFKNETTGLVAQDTKKISTTAIDAGAPYTNLGSMEANGFDLSLNYSD